MRKMNLFSSGIILLPLVTIMLLTSFHTPDDDFLVSGGVLTFTVRTVTQNGTYAPKNVFAIWIEDADGFVKTRKAMANQRKQYLYTWHAASAYNVVDAITGPTLTSHQTHTVTWNCTDLSGNIVPDGEYTVWVEFTEKHAQGPLYALTFTKGPNAQSLSPADETYFKDIQLDFVPLTADFSADLTEICQGESVTFTDLSIGATSWSWNFGSGASPASATSQGPHTVTYSTAGQKSVSLTINGSLTETKTNYINVITTPEATFSYSGLDYTVNFENNSLNALTYLWDFGDGETSTEENPTHTFATAGSYNVTLTAENQLCLNSTSQEILLPLTGITQFNTSNKLFRIFPNPSAGIVNIELSHFAEHGVLKVYNSFGKIVNETLITGSAAIIDLTNQCEGP
ncbi:MAG: DUF2271 domain-containing protein, partial [Bacteroidetes bacterium]|nr:DUF2271 domain-containing protein [Bacteroidota bacterium]